MKKIIKLFIIILVLPSVSANAGKLWPFKRTINQYDTQGRRQGKWVSYWDDDRKVPMNIEHYKDGREIGRCRYFYQDGSKRLQFKAFKDGRMKVKYLTEEGRKEKKGWAVMLYTPDEIRYSWNGPWKFYEKGKLVRKAVYKMGEETQSTGRSGNRAKR